tara:strand:+ start:756 stop:1478 length:723 start_codon:yes stop_codon:yes gene_type:complete
MIYLLNDHKTGYTVTNKLVNSLNCGVQVRTFFNFSKEYNTDDKYIVVIRNPKEVIISGYLYHKKCTEWWATNRGINYYGGWLEKLTPEVLRENEENIKHASTFSAGCPYRVKLSSIPEKDGILMEMSCVARLTLEGMYNLPHYGKKNVITVKYEDLVYNHDKTVSDICEFVGVPPEPVLAKTLQDNILNLKENGIVLEHSTNTDLMYNRYEKYWNEEIERKFKETFPHDIMSKHGYKEMD